jgi:nitrogen fixation protein NifB
LFTLDKVESMQIDYQAAMRRRVEYQAAIEANRLARKDRTGETYIALSSLKTRKQESRPVLMAVASSGGGMINQHFGHTREFLIYEASATEVRFIGHRKVDRYCSGGDTCGDGSTTLQKIIRTLEGCEAVLCSKIGYEPWEQLEQAGIAPNGEHAMAPIEAAVAAVYAEMVERGLPAKKTSVTQLQAEA